MEPRIQYARTSDGVRIAFWTMGEGLPLVATPLSTFSHIELEWRIPLYRRVYERVAEKRMTVRYDPRGSGLSDRDVTEISLDTCLADLEAVVDCLGVEKIALAGSIDFGPVAIAYAATHPERVSRLILWCAYARTSEHLASSPHLQAVVALRDQDWEVFTETAAHVSLGWSVGDDARGLAAYMRAATTPEAYRCAVAAWSAFDVSALMPRIQAPTLVVHRRQVPYPTVDQARELAAGINGARLVLLEGESLSPAIGDLEAFISTMDEFLSEGEPARATARPAPPSTFRTVLFTDLVGHTEMMSRLGDERGRAVLREHERITRDVLKAHGGTEVKTMGDGFMASFGSVTKAVECAVALQKAFDDRNRGVGAQHPASTSDLASTKDAGASIAPASSPGAAPLRASEPGPTPVEPLHIRVGLNAGEPIEEDGDLFGATVILAARIAAKAEGGEILVANAVRELCSGKGFLFSDRGDFVAKGFEDPVRVYEVRWRD